MSDPTRADRSGSEPTNEDRRRWAQVALDAYKSQPGLDTGEETTTIGDLIADLLHLAGDDAALLHERAWRHYEEER